jgi:hypothetical protein
VTRSVLILVLVAAAGAVPRAQAVADPKNAPPTTLPRIALEDLPSSGTIGGLLETTIPEFISDRIDGGGLGVGNEPRLGAWGSSWTQAAFQFDEIDLTDAGIAGASLLFLDPDMLQTVETATGMVSADRSSSGVGVRLIPRPPTTDWRGHAESLFGFTPGTPAPVPVPSIASLRGWSRISASAGGPLRGDRVSTGFGVSVANGTRLERGDSTILHAQQTSGFAQMLFTPSDEDEVFAAVVGRSARAPSDGRLWIGQPDARQHVSDLLAASHWRHRAHQTSLTIAGGLFRSSVDSEQPPAALAYIDSIQDRPVMQAISESTSRQRWSVVARATGLPDTENRWLRGGRAGVELDGGTATERGPLASIVAETVEGFPARIWLIAAPATDRHRHGTNANAYLAEHFDLIPRVSVDAGIRWEGVSAAGDGVTSLGWSSWFPRVSLRWDAIPQRVSGFLGVARYGHRIPLDILSYSDPSSTSAQVFRWDDRNGDGRFENGEAGPLVARVGGATSAIDAGLERPYVDELVLGAEWRPSSAWTVRLMGHTWQQHGSMTVANTGAPLSAYTVTTVPDAGEDVLDPSDDRLLPVYNRRIESFGADEYLLTTSPGPATISDGLELTAVHTGDRLWAMVGATAGQSSGPAAARGFQVFQNDGALPRDTLADPNAATYAVGSYFSDRNFTIKTAGTYQFPHHVHLGIVARYQDGQGFSRIVIAQGLNQGTEAIRAYRNGRTRFSYTLTLDSRVQVGLGPGSRFRIVWDTFNLLNMSNEVEESVVTGPAFRTSTALQPPRTMHVGLRVAF